MLRFAKKQGIIRYDRQNREWIDRDGYLVQTFYADIDEDDILNIMTMNEKLMLLTKNGYEFAPVYVYEHSDITIRMEPFGDPWDSGQAGWIYVTKDAIEKEWGKLKDWRKKAREVMEGEFSAYKMYVDGDVYGYIAETYNEIRKEFSGDDSCWGFYSDKWGDKLLDEIISEAGYGSPEYVDTLEELHPLKVLTDAEFRRIDEDDFERFCQSANMYVAS